MDRHLALAETGERNHDADHGGNGALATAAPDQWFQSLAMTTATFMPPSVPASSQTKYISKQRVTIQYK
ncbi:hypothetical protein ACN0IV_05100 [Trabulsiella odontotermitis]|uniref:hypothetical protein n=1 Tax=Trabulsiella odontotermitis TaxID=379893 RepID=UPI003AD31EF1